MESYLSLRRISKSYRMDYGEITPLRHVSLDIDSGESLSIMGPSGSGKSTLLNILGCLDRPTQGEYLFGGQSIGDLDDTTLSQIRSEKIGFVFQSFNLISHLTVYENLSVPFQYLRDPPPDVDACIRKALAIVNLSHRLDHNPNELSGGEMQRVAIARAIAKRPSMILADEPTGNLDTVNSGVVVDLLKEINRQGVTLIVITHDPNVSAQFGRTIRMLDGEIVGL